MIYLSYIACKGTIKRAENQENLEFSRVEVLLMGHLASYFDYEASLVISSSMIITSLMAMCSEEAEHIGQKKAAPV